MEVQEFPDVQSYSEKRSNTGKNIVQVLICLPEV